MKRVKPLFFLSISLFFISTVYATTSYLYNSNEIGYDNSKSKLTKTNLKEAVEELYTKCSSAPTKCPDGYTCEIPICKRVTKASQLNTTTCEQSSNYCGAVEGNGSTITYGKAKALGAPLETGDAFDCDLNGNGTYDQRFYYVSDYYDTSTKSFNKSVGVLIYYSNTLNGSASDGTAAYDSSTKNYNGPVTAITHIPLSNSWSNVSLYNATRAILNESGEGTASSRNLPTAFSYSGYSSRLLTYQELYKGCYDGSTDVTSSGGLNNCNFLFENTKYSSSDLTSTGSWLETPSSSSINKVYIAAASDRSLMYNRVDNSGNTGVRPVIEVPKNRLYIGKYGLFEEDGELYYYLKEEKQTGWQQVNGDYYLFDSTTKAAKKNYWYQFNDRWYYFGSDGKMALGEKEINGSLYYFYKPEPYSSSSQIGQMAYNEFIGDGSVDYWYGADGKKLTTETYTWYQDSNGWWYGNANWYPRSESWWINGRRYTFDASGHSVN